LLSETILIIEDEQHIAELVKLYLEAEGYETASTSDGLQALETFRSLSPSLIILDIMLPGMDGWDICREIRKESIVPIIMLTAKESEADKVLGLGLGADDFLTKPFSPRELVARVQAVLRRSKLIVEEQGSCVLAFGVLRIDIPKREVVLDGKAILLRAKEFDLLTELANNPGIVFTRERLLEKVWGYDFYGEVRTVDVHVRRIREKLDDVRETPRFIETVWGVGYKFKGKKDV